MDAAEFDKFADEYYAQHAANIRVSGESPEYFAAYKITEVYRLCSRVGVQPERILDFGAGIGASVPHFHSRFPSASLTCVDVSTRSLDIARSRFPDDATYTVFEPPAIPYPDGTFDLAFAACVFHHIPHDEHVYLCREIGRVLRPGSPFVVFEHNPFNPLTVHAVNTCPFDENAVLLRPRQLQNTLKSAGFAKVTTRYCVFFPRILRALRPAESHLHWCPLGAQYYAVGSAP